MSASLRLFKKQREGAVLRLMGINIYAANHAVPHQNRHAVWQRKEA